MQKFDVQIALEGVREARSKWNTAVRQFNADADKVMTRLLHEAAANYMSSEQVAKHSGLSPKRVRSLMRLAGLNPSRGKNLLAKHAAEALATNSELLGIAPHEMDLTSPLAYLPMGSELRQALTDKTVSKVTELDDPTCRCSDRSGYHRNWNEYLHTCMDCGLPIKRVSGNEVTAEMIEAFRVAWHEADDKGLEGHRVAAGLMAALAAR